MITPRRLSSTIVLVSLALMFGAISVHGAPEAQNTVSTLTQTPLMSSLLNIVTTIGDDQFATVDLTTLVDPSTTATQHYGPYEGSSVDSGTCNIHWADDKFQRHFTIFDRGGSVVVVEQFKDGSFTTVAGPSPGACEMTPPSGGMVRAGVTGGMHGYFIIPIPPGISQSSRDPHCNAITMTNSPCDPTAVFMNSHFDTCVYPSVCHATTFFFVYAAPDQGLIDHSWKNASADRGGNRGDIRST